MRRSIASVLVVVAATAPARVAAQTVPAPDVSAIDDPAIAVVTALLVAERTLLAEALERYRALVRERPEPLGRLAQLRQELDAELAKESGAVVERLDQLVEVAGQAGATVGERVEAELETVRLIGGHVRRIALLERQLDALEGGRSEEEVGALSGTWDLVLLPLDQKGSCVLEQSGAVVSGTYRLQGGYSGSLQGTLVNRKVYLVRIDTQLGKIMELEGFASADGRTLSGTWLNYELAGAAGSTGHWTATRRAPTP
jgi:hypothetical protein